VFLDEPEVLHFINVRLARRGEAPEQRLSISVLERELKSSFPNWQRGKKSRDTIIEEFKMKLISPPVQNRGDMMHSVLENSIPMTLAASQNLRCATPQAQEFMRRREDMMGRLERVRAKNGRRASSTQPATST